VRSGFAGGFAGGFTPTVCKVPTGSAYSRLPWIRTAGIEAAKHIYSITDQDDFPHTIWYLRTLESTIEIGHTTWARSQPSKSVAGGLHF